MAVSSAPRILDRYVLHGEIASGGMATVHLGRLLGQAGFARTVAIKRLHAQFARDPEFVAMFLDEARIAARIRHPNVVATLDVVASEGELFLVMDYVEGESLSRLVRASKRKGGPPPVAVSCAILAGVLRGLHAAHEAKGDDGKPLGIVHRDVSPHNVLVGIDGLPRVLDFGVAKAIGRLQVTREGQLKGKIPYMAPEQIRRGGVVTRKTDVYGASVVLWETLVAKRLFDAEEESQVLDAVLDPKVDKPSDWNPEVPHALDDIVLRGLSADPNARFATALEMAEAIEKAVPLASTSELGAWVASLAEEALSERAMHVAQAESSGAIAAVYAPPLRITPPDVATQPSTNAVTIVVGVIIAWLSLRSAATHENAGNQGISSSSSTSAISTNEVAPPPPSPSASNDVAPPPPAVASTPKVKTTATTKPPTVFVPPAKTTTTTTTANTANVKNGPCDPPYFYKDGIKNWKPECL